MWPKSGKNLRYITSVALRELEFGGEWKKSKCNFEGRAAHTHSHMGSTSRGKVMTDETKPISAVSKICVENIHKIYIFSCLLLFQAVKNEPEDLTGHRKDSPSAHDPVDRYAYACACASIFES